MMPLDGTPAVNAVAPARRDAKRPWALALARRYARRSLRRSFDGVFVHGLDDVIALTRQGPVIFAANHVCWWDAFALVLVDEACGTDGRVLMDEQNLARLPFFGAIGALPISTTGGARVRRQLADATATLKGPGRTLWIFPQGRQRAWHLRPLGFQPGLALLARRAGVPVIPVSLAYPWQEAPRPSLVLRFGPPVDGSDVAAVEAAVAAGLDAIDAAVDGRDLASQGTVLVPSTSPRGTEDGFFARLLRRLMGAP